MASKRYFLLHGRLDRPQQNTSHHGPWLKNAAPPARPPSLFPDHNHIQKATTILTLTIAINLAAPRFVSILTRKTYYIVSNTQTLVIRKPQEREHQIQNNNQGVKRYKIYEQVNSSHVRLLSYQIHFK
jgi:hypothetical protein